MRLPHSAYNYILKEKFSNKNTQTIVNGESLVYLTQVHIIENMAIS
jgi:hypothetical protein